MAGGDGDDAPASAVHDAQVRAMFLAGGEVGRHLMTVDWAATPLGPPASWPQSLRTVVRMLLTSRFAMWMAWGPELTFFCNDAYRRDTLGKKYPWALGRPTPEVWAEIWPEIAPRVETVLRTGTATWDEALMLFLERSGYVEETYHTFSYSPLTDDAGEVAGMLCVVSEDTLRVISERRMTTLRDLGSELATVRTEPEVFAAAERHLGAADHSLPFTLLYLFDDGATTARLVCSTGMPDGHPAAPVTIDPAAPDEVWPASVLADGKAITVTDLDERFPKLPTGAWQAPPTQARLVPLTQQGRAEPYGFLVVGLNRYRVFDEAYQGYLDLIAGQLAAGIASARAYAAERRRAEALAELDRTKTAFFTNISHEFRTPLTLLLGPAEDALADLANPLLAPHQSRFEIIHRNAKRLLGLVNTLLDFSRLESGTATAHYEPLDLAGYTVELAETFRPAVERAGLTLTVDCPPLGEPVHADREMWAKIVLNLLSNALKFTFSGGITVRLRPLDGMVELAVTDTGVGIEPADQAKIFERFHRVTGVRSRTHEGSGIGLALVAELARLHGGTAAVHSTLGEGSTFTVRVRPDGGRRSSDPVVSAGLADAVATELQSEPYVREAMRWLDPVEPAIPNAAGAPSSHADGDRPRVLVVDDNADMRTYITTLLAVYYTVETAPDGEAALEKARANPPDLVLTDVTMPNLDGFGLLAALRADPATTFIPVVMLSARAGDEATVEGLEAGADDYLVKPFSARELLARVRANLELDRARRARTELEHSRKLLDQAQRLAAVGSWELDLATGAIVGSDEYVRQLGLSPEDLRTGGFDEAVRRVHPDDAAPLRAALEAAARGEPLDIEIRLVNPDGTVRLHRAIGELERHADGSPARLRGSIQDITEQRRAEQAMAAAAAAQEAASREHRIADELQRSLLPADSFDPDQLHVASYYQAGVEGTQVGGDWYDVIELGADRTALVMGDVMGRGVRAAAVMGQLRAAVRAYARLDLPPADVLEFLDGVVRDLGNDQIVTCVYAVYDPGDARLTYANAGHLPPVLVSPDGSVRRLTGAAGPPLGTGPVTLSEEQVVLPQGAILALYTDGLVERRGSDLDAGIDKLTAQLTRITAPLAEVPHALVDALLPDGPNDDIAVLLAQATAQPQQTTSAVRHIEAEERAVHDARRFATTTLSGWGVPETRTREIVLLVSELVTNAVLYGASPIELRMRRTSGHVVLEVHDAAPFLPRKLRPAPDDEHGRGLHLVAHLADRWGTRPTPHGKAVWCVFSTPHPDGESSSRAG
ncbi:SpoIIE family protein phosphatase [Planosporangium thailandense]|uniref:histidine kinase n=1 Tax=Planosporangium thailandense TaxID=765197 RepID=A0ABX0XUC0_9ACTN|nr:SpoIIE family protein phosphatase [Planosporangium thailandense]NJC69616.1 SpoIIE family protein phosphatase [Planosporangium thailandense]